MRLFLLGFLLPFLCIAETEIKLEENNHIYLNQPFREDTVATLMNDALEKHANLEVGQPLYLVLYSPGGSIMAGRKLINFLQNIGREVHTITIFSASMAFHTVQNLGKRYLLDNGTLMTHKARGGFQGEFPGQLESRYYWIISIISKMNKTVANRTNGVHSLKSYLDLHENEYWCDGSNCLKQGFIDDVAKVSCGRSLQGTREQVINSMFGSFIAEFSKCPLVTAPVGFRASNIFDFESKISTLNFNYEEFSKPKFDPKALVWELER